MSATVPCESCGRPGCDSVGDRCGCDRIICEHCMNDARLWHFKGGGHLLLQGIIAKALGADENSLRAQRLGLALLGLVNRTAAFQVERFPHQPLKAKCEHLVREAKELRAAPGDLTENADCLILTLGINAVNARTIEDLIIAAHAKMDVCENRQWGEADADGVQHHIEEAR